MIKFTWDTVFCWPREMCAAGLEGGYWGTGTEEISSRSLVKAAFEAGGQKGQTCHVPGSAGKLTDRWAVSPVAVNPSGDLQTVGSALTAWLEA